tara:strand:+ start:650 stop:886 length:237 start_codon:yes stop_codon:yes gene_type:complete
VVWAVEAREAWAVVASREAPTVVVASREVPTAAAGCQAEQLAAVVEGWAEVPKAAAGRRYLPTPAGMWFPRQVEGSGT